MRGASSWTRATSRLQVALVAPIVVVLATALPAACAHDQVAPDLGTDAGATDARDDGADATHGDTSDANPLDADEAGDASDFTDAGDASDAPDADLGDVADDADGFDGVYGGACADAATEASAPSGSCNVVIQSWPDEGHTHVPVGSVVDYCTMPPNSGDHYDVWAHYRTYDAPVPWPYLVHDMEHGGVLVLYKCAAGATCSTVASQLQAVIDARPVDPLCDADAGILRRVILEPAPDLDVPVAAAAWQWTYEASCVDAASLGAFIDAHYAMAAENFCGDGAYPP